MYRYFKTTDIKHWKDVLQDLVQNFKISRHRIVNMTQEIAVQDPYVVTKKLTN